MMKKFLAMFVTLVMLSTLCACNASNQRTEDKERIRTALTDIKDWDVADQIKNEVVSYRESGALEYEPHGVYNLTGQNCKVYTFDGVNSFYEAVCLDEEEDFVIIIHNTVDHGVSFWSGIRKGAKFCGLTENYILYTENSIVIAVSILEKENGQIGEYAYEVVPFDELSKEEQDTAIYPTASYITQF